MAGSDEPADSLYRIADRAAAALRLEPVEKRRKILIDALSAQQPLPRELPSQSKALANHAWPLIVTTNYDDILPHLMSSRKPKVLGRSPDHCAQITRSLDVFGDPQIWYVQGHVPGVVAPDAEPDPAQAALVGQVVVGHQHYQQAINADTVFRRTFAEVFRRRSLLFVGSGLAESYMVNLIAEALFALGPSPLPHYALFCDAERSKIENSEHSFDALADMAGEARDAGEYARCFDIPAVTEGMPTVFDRRPTNVSAAEFPRWSRQKLVALRSACEENHGVAFTPFLEFLIQEGERVDDAARDYMSDFETALGLSTDDGALQHAAKNFALVYAGGRLAIDANILPWKPEQLLSAIVECFTAGMRNIGLHESVSSRAQKILRTKLQETKLPLKAKGGIDPDQHDGFREKAENGATMLTVKAAAMRAWFPDTAQFRAALVWLDDTGRLVKSDSNSQSSGKGTEWAVTSPRWSNDKKVKSIRFRSRGSKQT